MKPFLNSFMVICPLLSSSMFRNILPISRIPPGPLDRAVSLILSRGTVAFFSSSLTFTANSFSCLFVEPISGKRFFLKFTKNFWNFQNERKLMQFSKKMLTERFTSNTLILFRIFRTKKWRTYEKWNSFLIHESHVHKNNRMYPSKFWLIIRSNS